MSVSEHYRDHLARVAGEVDVLALRSARLADFRQKFGRGLSQPIRDELSASALHLSSIASDLKRLAASPTHSEAAAEVIEVARRLGVAV